MKKIQCIYKSFIYLSILNILYKCSAVHISLKLDKVCMSLSIKVG